MRLYAADLRTPIGELWLLGTDKGLLALRLGKGRLQRLCPGPWTYDPEALSQPLDELRGYFEGRVKVFRTPLVLRGTPFQVRVWEWVRGIPWGETRTYREVAEGIGAPRAARAVGGALRANPLPLFVPCHRVIGVSDLGGFSLSRGIKEFLLRHEGIRCPTTRRPG